MEVLPTLLGSMLACISVEYRKETLAACTCEVDDEAARTILRRCRSCDIET